MAEPAARKKVTRQTYASTNTGVSLPMCFCQMKRTSITCWSKGWCWWYRKYASGDTVLEGLERNAREGRKGLWADPQLVPPWEWRSYKSFSL